MKTNRVWIEIAILGTAIACALALLLATLGAAAGAAVSEVRSSARDDNTANLRRHGDLLPLWREAFRCPRPNSSNLYPRLCARRSELRRGRCGCDIPPRWRLECSEKAGRTACPRRGRAQGKNHQDLICRCGELAGDTEMRYPGN